MEDFAISILSAFGLSILLTEMNETWPVKPIYTGLKWLLSLPHKKLGEMLDCSVCTAFWAALVCDIMMYYIWGRSFMWPLSGFAASGLTYAFFLSVQDEK